MRREETIHRYKRYIKTRTDLDPRELRGRDLVCWCALNVPCHADVLLQFANRSGK